MKINGKEVEITEQLSLSDLLLQENYNLATVVVELNGQVIVQDQFSQTYVQNGDYAEVLNFVGGG
jgi:sulfur carrier protein